MGLRTLAKVKTHGSERRKEKSRVRERVPNVEIVELFAAWSGRPAWFRFRLEIDAGRRLTSAPVSTRKRNPKLVSVT